MMIMKTNQNKMRRVVISRKRVVELGFLVVFLLVVQCLEMVEGRSYVVGDKQGWDLDPSEISNWVRGKKFKAGDVLVFNYKTDGGDLYGLARVNKTGYDLCDSERGHAKKFRSGHDHVKLVKGFNYFICCDKDYCGYGMKMVVYAK